MEIKLVIILFESDFWILSQEETKIWLMLLVYPFFLICNYCYQFNFKTKKKNENLQKLKN